MEAHPFSPQPAQGQEAHPAHFPSQQASQEAAAGEEEVLLQQQLEAAVAEAGALLLLLRERAEAVERHCP
jgi:hypothetical protein